MERKIRFSQIILTQLDIIDAYLLEHWGENATDTFNIKFKTTVIQLAKTPEMGTPTESGRYSFPLRMYRVHYTFDDSFLKVAFIQDMRSSKEMIDIE